jgi:hypothetical protein
LPVAAPDRTLSAFVDEYLAAHAVGREPTTIRTLRDRLRYARDTFGEVKLRDLERRAQEVADWQRTLPEKSRYGPRSYLNLHDWRRDDGHPALKATGLPKCGLYRLRHTFAANALAAGLGIYELARNMGTSVKMIDDTYGHLIEGAEDAARVKLDALAGRLAQERLADPGAEAGTEERKAPH